MAAGVVGVGRWLVVSLPHRWCGLTVGGFGLFVLRMGWLVVVWLVLVLRWVSLCLWLGTRGLGCWLPVEVALQQQSLGLQLKQIEAQNRLANAEATKTITEANKIAGVDTEGAKLDNEWKKIENRIQLSRENIEASNVTAAEANAQKAVAEWNSAMAKAEVDQATKRTPIVTGKQIGRAHV